MPSICAFDSFLGIPIGITSYAIVLEVHAINAGIKKYKSIIKKKKKKNDKIVLLEKPNLNSIEVVAKRFIINLKNKMTSESKNMYIANLADIVNK